MRISPRICVSSCECVRISVNLFANVRVSPANLRGPSANVRECARMCANVRESANVRECGANVRESARMCANAAVYLRECVANVCECSRECLRMFAYLSRMFAKACRICGWTWSRQPSNGPEVPYTLHTHPRCWEAGGRAPDRHRPALKRQPRDGGEA